MLLALLDKEYRVIFQFGNHNMYLSNFKKAVFIDNKPNFNIKYGNGRILMFQWNNFIRKIRKKRFEKIKQKNKIINFWKNERKLFLYNLKPYLDDVMINHIISFVN